MNIVYDYQIFNLQKYGGVSRYFSEIIKRIAKLEGFETKVLAGFYTNEYLKFVDSSLVIGIPITPITRTTRITDIFNKQLSKVWWNFNNSVDIVHETYYSSRSVAPKSCKTVITVYDMIHEKLGHIYKEQLRDFSIVKNKAIQRADHIICISHQTRKDLIEILNVPPSKTTVVHLGFSFSSNKIANYSTFLYNLNQPYILYVGDRRGYKNFRFLLKAYGNCSKLKNNFNLVCIGAKKFSREELMMMNDLGLDENQVQYIAGDDQTLTQLYKQASIFVYPSLYEGFGIPPLEAMSFNCPVACSNTSSLPEIVGKAAEFFDPYDNDSIASALERVLFSSKRSKELIELGRERVKQFSWETCARQTSLVYSSLV